MNLIQYWNLELINETDRRENLNYQSPGVAYRHSEKLKTSDWEEKYAITIERLCKVNHAGLARYSIQNSNIRSNLLITHQILINEFISPLTMGTLDHRF